MKVMADTINGVFYVDSFDDYSDIQPEILSEEDFYDELKTLSDDRVVAAELSKDMRVKIEAHYGIRKL